MTGSRHAKGRGNEPQPAATIPKPPTWLDPEALKVYRHLAGEMAKTPGWLTEVDGWLLALHSQAASDVGRLTREVRREGQVIQLVNKHGEQYPRRNPKTLLLREAGALVLKTAGELGLTPASRSRVTIAPTKPDTPNPFDDLGRSR